MNKFQNQLILLCPDVPVHRIKIYAEDLENNGRIRVFTCASLKEHGTIPITNHTTDVLTVGSSALVKTWNSILSGKSKFLERGDIQYMRKMCRIMMFALANADKVWHQESYMAYAMMRDLGYETRLNDQTLDPSLLSERKSRWIKTKSQDERFFMAWLDWAINMTTQVLADIQSMLDKPFAVLRDSDLERLLLAHAYIFAALREAEMVRSLVSKTSDGLSIVHIETQQRRTLKNALNAAGKNVLVFGEDFTG